jgi:hypothetical protein
MENSLLQQLTNLREQAVRRAVETSPEVAALNKAIEDIQSTGEPRGEVVSIKPSVDGSTVEPGEFRFMLVVDAVRAYLSKLGRPANVETELLPAMLKGGAKTRGNVPVRMRVLRTTIRMNSIKPTHPFTYDKQRQTVALRAAAVRKIG